MVKRMGNLSVFSKVGMVILHQRNDTIHFYSHSLELNNTNDFMLH